MAFSDILGHETQLDVIRRMIKTERVPHALLFYGDGGIGKRLIATEFAKAMNCTSAGPDTGAGLFGDLEPPDGGCGNCQPCHNIAAGCHPNVSVMQLEENPDTGKMRQEIVISQVHAAREYLSLKPVGEGSKVLIVDGAELMNTSAANAFLKTLEEPPVRTHIVLVTSRPGMLLETINSRTRAIGFQPLPDGVVRDALVTRKGMKPADAELVAKVSMGRLGLALATDPKDVRKERKRFLDALAKIDEGGYTDILGLAERVAKDADRLASFVREARLFFRDIQVVWMSGEYGYAYYGNAAEELSRWSERFGPDGADTALRLTEKAAFALDKTYNNRMAAEELFLGIKEDALGLTARA